MIKLFVLFAIIVSFVPGISRAQAAATERLEESFAYWKPFEVSAEEDPKVAEAKEIFQRLLLGWEETRVAPELHVVQAGQGLLDAASLSDGTILLSRDAIDICWKGGEKSRRDRLAFVLAHELSHQRADHLWHRQFFRLAGQQAPSVQGRMLGRMRMDQLERESHDAKELQADREALLLMAMVGFDPQNVLSGKGRFFYQWIENVGGLHCKAEPGHRECLKMNKRIERIRIHWEEAVRQSIFFELGVQSYVAGHYQEARKFFTVYGRQFPGREVHNNIGLSHIGEAMFLRKQLLEKDAYLGTEFVYPTILAEAPRISKNSAKTREGMRSSSASNARLKKEMEVQLNQAIASFERAIKIDPGHRPTYWNLISSYLLSGNAPLAYGVTAGLYVKRFARDATATMFLGISAHLEGEDQKAQLMFEEALQTVDESLYETLRMNRAVFLKAIGDRQGARAEWKKLADFGKKNGDEALFRLALKQMRNQADSISAPKPGALEKIKGFAIGHTVSSLFLETPGLKKEEIWLEGEKITLYYFNNGARMAVDANHRIIGLWQTGGEVETAAGIRKGDDLAKAGRAYGLPTRTIRTIQGNYLAYDLHQIALRFVDGKVAAWLLYGGMP